MKLKVLSIAVAGGLLAATSSHADIVTYVGSTATTPTYNRLLEDLSGLSAVGTNTHYDARSFTVSAGGEYTFLSTARFDNFTFLYGPTFAPVTPFANARAGNDDLLGFTTSGLSYALTAGTSYTVVTTGFGNTDSGFFSNTVGGPGTVNFTSPAPAPASSANVFTFTGNTTSGPAFNRPLEDLSGLSAVGTAVRYDTFEFSVSTTAEYTFLSTGMFDNFTFLYGASFDPSAPLVNALFGNDDLLGFTTSGFSYTLTAGTMYTLVTTGFGNTDWGSFSETIGGPGRVIPLVAAVPEPETYALMLAGLGALGWVARRRRVSGAKSA